MKRQNYQEPEYRHPLQRFRTLMPHRMRRVLLVASRYDYFLLEEDGRLDDLILSEFLDFNLGTSKWMTRVSSGHDALRAVQRRRFDLVLLTAHIRDMQPWECAHRLQELRPSVAIVPLAFDQRELDEFRSHEDINQYERPFLWQGDSRIVLGIVQSLEDRRNVEHDTLRVGVSSVILIEDSVRYYSSFLPTLYAELMKQSQVVISEGFNLQHKLMRLRARPKILHCINYEQAEEYYRKFRPFVLGVISDVNFPRGGRSVPDAGLEFARMVRDTDPDLPIMVQTSDPEYADKVDEVRAAMVLKGSPLLLHQLSAFMRDSFGFGDFIFQDEDGTVHERATDLRGLEELIGTVSDELIMRHAESNHFSTWLRARTEFGLAEDLRWRKASDFDSANDLRMFLIDSIQRFRRERQLGVVSLFHKETFQKDTSFARIGMGSLGGKARGIAFVRQLLRNYHLSQRFLPEVDCMVPSAVVLSTEVFDQFLDYNQLRDYALQETDDDALETRFITGRFSDNVFQRMLDFLDLADYPLAVRSSSLLEDSQYFPFTGVYQTYMVPNNHPDREIRVKELAHAIKRVYASTFCQRSKQYIQTTPYRLEEEKMAVIIQRVVGTQHEQRFYPDISGVAKSYNFYPVAPMKPEDGIVTVALGFGQTVVDGGKAVSFSPPYPHHPVHFSTPDAIRKHAQTEFFALDLEDTTTSPDPAAELKLTSYGTKTAAEDHTLDVLGSIYSPENNAVYDGVGREGVPLITFAPILKHDLFPLAEITRTLLDIGSRSLNMPAEIEFAINLSVPADEPKQFAVLQIRPFVHEVKQDVEIGEIDESDQVCFSTTVLGNGVFDDLYDIVVVDRESFDRSRSVEAAQDVAALNAALVAENRNYVLVGVGRWGASDPWLGIPVTWEQIAGAKVIVESDFKDLPVTPSQGSHFFQNLTAAGVGYFTVGAQSTSGFVDWDWLGAQEAVERKPLAYHVRLSWPLAVMMNGRAGKGVILKPSVPSS